MSAKLNSTELAELRNLIETTKREVTSEPLALYTVTMADQSGKAYPGEFPVYMTEHRASAIDDTKMMAVNGRLVSIQSIVRAE